ncbi:MAG: flagellar protein FlaG [Succinivibrio sp.]|nr:flagellar protein FlaG [Succinivibrio sp.]
MINQVAQYNNGFNPQAALSMGVENSYIAKQEERKTKVAPVNTESKSSEVSEEKVNSEAARANYRNSVSEKEEVKQATSLEEQAKAAAEKAKEEAAEASHEKAKELISKLNGQNIGLSFSIDKDSETTIINVTDKTTDDLVRKIPSDEFLKLMKSIDEFEEKYMEPSNSSSSSNSSPESAKGKLLDAEA